MARSAYLPLAADRYEPCVRTIVFRGFDLRSVALRAQVRLTEDTPGAPLVDLQTVTNGNAEGLRLTNYQVVGGLPVSTIELVINETTMEALPYLGELGSPSPMAYDLQATIGGRKRKLVGGPFVVLPGVTGADDAPADRSTGWGGVQRPQTWTTATLQFSDDRAEVSVTGLDLLDAALGELFLRRAAERARIEARSLIYGVSDPREIQLFGAEATELAFADGFYRDGLIVKQLAEVTGWEASGSLPIDGRGMLVSGSAAAGINRPNQGDVTIIVEADMPALDGSLKVLASYVGPTLYENVNIIRNEGGTYAMQLARTDEATLQVNGPADPAARRMRVALSIGARQTRVSFAGGAVLRIDSPRPPSLNRLWLGRLALGNGNPLEGRILRAAIYGHAVSDETLMQMAGGPVTNDEIKNLIDEKIKTHDNDDRAHALEVTRRAVELADSKTGLWSIKASDSFGGADGSPLGNSEVGGIAWTSPAGLVRSGGRIRHPSNGFGGAWLNSGARDGQVEGDLYPGSAGEASLFFRISADTAAFFLLQRSGDGGITLNNVSGGTTTRIAPLLALPVVAGERFKVRFIGARIWVFRVVAGEEALLFDVTDTRRVAATIHGIRLNGGGSVDNFRVLQREAI